MTAQNRWEDWLAMAGASSCWLYPLPLEWVAQVYNLDTPHDADIASPPRSPRSPPGPCRPGGGGAGGGQPARAAGD